MKVTSPTGSKIIGTYDTIQATALVYGFRSGPNGLLEYEYAGETEVDWDSQETIMKDGERTFVDGEGNVWRESQLVITEDT